MRTVTGEYNRHGYGVYADGIPVHSAGNHKLESTKTVDAYSAEALSLRAIRSMCIKTTREISAERRAIYGGVERVPE